LANPVSVNTTLPTLTSAPPAPEEEKRLIKWRAGYTPVTQQPRTTAASQIRTTTTQVPLVAAPPASAGGGGFAEFAAQYQAAGAGSSAGPVLTDRGNKVYLNIVPEVGSETDTAYQRYRAAGLGVDLSKSKGLVDINTAIYEWYNFDEDKQAGLAQDMYRYGLLENAADYDQAFKIWSLACQHAAGYAEHGKQVTPYMVLDLLGGQFGKGNGLGGGPKTTTSTSRSTSVITDASAHNAVRAMFQEQMGRDPTKSELRRYSSMIISRSKAKPTVSTTTSTTTAAGNTTSDTVTKAGYGAEDVEEDLRSRTENDPEYGAYQAATTYMNVLQSIIGG